MRFAARLAVVLEGASPPGSSEAPSVPRTALGWARQQADRTAHELAAAGYAVHGDPGDLAPAEQPHPGRVDRGRTLELAVLACLRTWRLQGGTP